MASLSAGWRRVEGFFLYLYFRLVNATARLTITGAENLAEAHDSGRPILWTLWHGLNMLFLLYGKRNHTPSSFVVVITGDERGDILAELGRWLGAEAVGIDMAGNPVASGRKLLNVIKQLKSGQQSFLCPDGPDGPAYVPKDGVFFIAQKAQASILPFGAWTRHAYLIQRWDRFVVPLPFARIQVVIGAPIPVPKVVDEEALRGEVVTALHYAREQAQAAAGVTPWR